MTVAYFSALGAMAGLAGPVVLPIAVGGCWALAIRASVAMSGVPKKAGTFQLTLGLQLPK